MFCPSQPKGSMKILSKVFHGLVLFVGIVVAVGCGDNGRVRTYPVSGKVVFPDGKPLPGGNIICIGDSEEVALTARASINDDGTFVLGTYEEDDGATEGKHLVSIDPPVPENFNPDAGPPPKLIHTRYQHPDTSGLEFTVDPDGPNEVTLEVSLK